MASSTATFIIGPAGVGKSTLIKKLDETFNQFIPVNLDPSSYDSFPFKIDIRNFLDIDILMEEMDIGPNNALLKTFELLIKDEDLNRELRNELETYRNFNLLIDCPGQLEIFLHSKYFKELIDIFSRKFNVMFLFVLDVIGDERKFLSSCVSSALISSRFEFPFINLFSKCDTKELIFDQNFENTGKFEDHKLIVNEEGYINRLENINREDLDVLGRSFYDFLQTYGNNFLPLDLNDVEYLERLEREINNCVHLREE